MNWFRIFPKHKVDQKIMDLYMEIELLIQEIDEKLSNFTHYLYNHYKPMKKDKKIRSIEKINSFFKRLKEEYKDCYTIRENKKYYNFHKNRKSMAEKINIENYLKKLVNMLKEINRKVDNLNKSRIKENDFSDLVEYVENLAQNENIFEELKKEDKEEVINVINEIKKEAKENINKGLWLVCYGDDGRKLTYFSREIPMKKIKYLDLVPLLNLKNLNKRSMFINELHKDDNFSFYHYNLEIDGMNIHVFPRYYKKRLKNYLVAA